MMRVGPSSGHHDIDSAGFIAEAFEARGASLAVHLFPDEGPLPALDGGGPT